MKKINENLFHTYLDAKREGVLIRLSFYTSAEREREQEIFFFFLMAFLLAFWSPSLCHAKILSLQRDRWLESSLLAFIEERSLQFNQPDTPVSY